jgi:hypothetical protein
MRLKSWTARQANQLLGRSGQPFWQDESYDHWVRNRRQRDRMVRYIEDNPVSAGLVASPPPKHLGTPDSSQEM